MTKQSLAYLGAYAQAIRVYGVNAETGAFTFVSQTAASNPSFLAVHPNRRALYAVNEEGDGQGALSAFEIDEHDGSLNFINQQPTQGSYPCHVCLDATGAWAFVANYGGAPSLLVFPVLADGSLAPAKQVLHHAGGTPNNARQDASHAHSVTMSADNGFALVCDLGTNQILTYAFDANRGELQLHQVTNLHAGAGPRHFAFHPSQKFAYVLNELDNTVSAFAYDVEHGWLTLLHTISTLPAGYAGESAAADIHVHVSGKFVYASNRGHNSLAIFKVDEQTGWLSAVAHEQRGLAWTRNFAFHPNGRWLYAANQHDDDVVQFEIDTATGELAPLAFAVALEKPVCIQFVF